MISRDKKILRLSQAHVAPGMSLARWQSILTARGVDLTAANPWPEVPDKTLDALIAEIAAVVKAAGEAAPPVETFSPLDLYRPGEGSK